MIVWKVPNIFITVAVLTDAFVSIDRQIGNERADRFLSWEM